ncbi:DNA phosphorothioation-associated protein 4 [Oscillatoria sp. FACHB-1406]|uniref:DNA phosphorothioation-associated protein 4 n=1 Tax=Oscillatoria sp. FACHB-1406 TaxID=2692846 RepID=UPI001681CAD8|nr:DNA phosphorothioation-associated protein 4 [Oscillatoria sp. FACHB-1406]
MASSRIRIAKDKAEFVQALVDSPEKTGPFQTYADAIAFAAVWGFHHRKRTPLDSTLSQEPGPISLDVFISRGHYPAIELLAIAQTQNPTILSSFDSSAEAQRVSIFEEYANGGLELLAEELRGAIDYSDRILSILARDRFPTEKSSDEEFDLSRFL